MMSSKATYLNKLYSRFNFNMIDVGESMSGSTPPSIFVGREGYPKVFVGPLIPPVHGDTQIMDLPEKWITGGKTIQDIINYRINLVRGKELINIKNVNAKPVQTMREIALAKDSLGLDAEFKNKPRGIFINEHMPPFGPSAPLKHLKLNENAKWNMGLEKAFYDTDLKARNAIIGLYEKGMFVTTIQKALSIGAFGLEKNRRLVPTRWSITAVDDTLSLHLMNTVKTYPVVDSYEVYEVDTFNNYFAILLMPGSWQYEFLEAFIQIFWNEQVLFSSHESFKGRKTYAEIGGCYYSTRLAVLEKLEEIKRQAGVLVFRESYSGYIPTGVWLVRESVRESLRKPPTRFGDMKTALNYISSRLRLPFSKYRKESSFLRQMTLNRFCM